MQLITAAHSTSKAEEKKSTRTHRRAILGTTWKLNETCKSVGRIIFTSLIDYVVYLSAPRAMHHLSLRDSMAGFVAFTPIKQLRRCLMIITSARLENAMI